MPFSRFVMGFSASAGLISGLTTVLIIGIIPAAAYAQKIDCYRQGDIIQCPGYGNFNYRNYRNSSNNSNQTPIESSIGDMYLQVLGRSADANGLRAYTDALQNGRISLVQVRGELANSPEPDQNINKIYQQILGRNVDRNGLRDSRRILESNGGSLDQVQSQLANANEARGRNGDRTFSLRDTLGIFK